jgi:hypothetical protein
MKRTAILLLLLPVISLACQSTPVTPPRSVPTSQSTDGQNQKRFEDTDAGIALDYPADWKPVTGTRSQLKVAAANGSTFTVDVPVLPPVPFGFIPIDRVESGYIDDVKKRITDATVTDLPDPSLPDAKQKRVKLSGHENGKSSIEEAVILVHAGHVYILSVDCDESTYPAARAVLDNAVKTLHWTH